MYVYLLVMPIEYREHIDLGVFASFDAAVAEHDKGHPIGRWVESIDDGRRQWVCDGRSKPGNVPCEMSIDEWPVQSG